MSDDPIKWLVEEFGAKMQDHVGDWKHPPFAWIGDIGADEWLIEYTVMPDDSGRWKVLGNTTTQPLTRADVARLCELFGVEVKK